jgi:outer membrane protein assembly factor BamB
MKPYGLVIAGLVALVLPLSAGASPTTHLVITSKVTRAPLVPISGWTTYHHDNSRNGYDASAPFFTGGPFSSWTKPVDQSIYAEPLAAGGRVYIATMGDSIYSFDATTGNQIWARTGVTAVGTADTAAYCSFNPGHIGIMSTPVIDPSTGILYAVGLTTTPSTE